MPTEMSPTARALRALEVLRARPGTTAEELGERLGVTGRAARRYVAILREAGVEVESVRGPGGGYRLGRGMRLPPVVFTQDEALSLVMAVLTAGTGPAGTAVDKVVRALPEAVAQRAAALREQAATPDRGTPRPDASLTSALVDGVTSGRRLRLGYRSASDDVWEEEVDPWAVLVRLGRWYLLCHSHRAEAVRVYRVDRVLRVVPTDRSFAPPSDLDPVATLEEHLGSGWELETRVIFEAEPTVVSRWVRPPMGRLEPHGSGSLLVGSTSNPTMYAGEWLAAIPLDFRVEGGPELRAATEALSARLAAAIEPPPS